MAGDHLQVLDALDTAKTQLYHFTTILIAGMGLFTDAYDLFSISLITKLLGRIYYTTNLNAPKPGTLPPKVSSALTGVALVGTLTGKLFFGWLGDKIVCSIAPCLSFSKSPKGVMATLCFFRFWLGFGIGGDYPLSATIMSEYANKKTRSRVRGCLLGGGFGILTSCIVALIVSVTFDHAYNKPTYAENAAASTVAKTDYIWRIIVMFGALPAALTFYWRMKMPE
ncbi:inorganic phosphate transporter 1-2-like [Salvia splendens]|uniref:inorganic phosphate transporter 1-2-like n=1 Tax=Salvia splendens TaxID=180675 RepID=UPI001C2723B5|nr:inorganic phosphate transporter 1-2-like [Salvia splendens]